MGKRFVFTAVMILLCFAANADETRSKLIASPGDGLRIDNGEGLGKRIKSEIVSYDMGKWLKKILEGVDKLRSIPYNPYDSLALYVVSRLGKDCGEMVGIKDIPNQSRFAGGRKDKVCLRSDGTIEYRGYGSLDTKLTGIVKVLSNVIYVEMKFEASRERCVFLRGHISRTDDLTGTIATEVWNNKGMCWKSQCSLNSVFIASNVTPFAGSMTVGCVDPWGRAVTKQLEFPIKQDN